MASSYLSCRTNIVENCVIVTSLSSPSAYVATSTESHGVKTDGFEKKKSFLFSITEGDNAGTFANFFEIYTKFGLKNPSIITSCDSVNIAT